MNPENENSIPEDIVLYTPHQVASILQLGVHSVWKFIRKRKLKAFCHLGRCNTKRIFITQQDLRVFMYTYYLDTYWSGHKRPQLPKKM